MADTIYTPDGKMHVLLGSTTMESIIREYAGGEAAKWVHREVVRNAYDEARAETDLGAYEESLSHIHGMMRDWVDDLTALVELAETGKTTKRAILVGLRGVIKNIKSEL